MYDINKSIRSGRICSTPDLRTSADGKRSIRFSLAVNRGEKATFFNYTAFDDKLVELIRKCSKGTWLTVIGSDDILKYTDNKGIGKKYFVTVCREIYFSGQRMANGDICSPNESCEQATDVGISEDDLPF